MSGPRTLPNATLDVPPSPDIATLEAAAESLARLGDFKNALALWAYILPLRMETERNA